jgi:hypothetical protein
MIEPELQRLALHCAKGPKQKALVEEMIEGKIEVARDTTAWVPAWIGTSAYPIVYGKVRLPKSSWINLRKRLNAAGFTFDHDPLPEKATVFTSTFVSMKY